MMTIKDNLRQASSCGDGFTLGAKGLVDGVKLVGGMSLNVGRANLTSIPPSVAATNNCVGITGELPGREMSTNVTTAASNKSPTSSASSISSESNMQVTGMTTNTNHNNPNPPNGSIVNPIVNEQQIHFQQQLLQLKQQQELQQRLLLQHFQQQQQQLAEQHEKQLQDRIKSLQEYLEAQKKFEEEQKEKAAKERLEKEKLEALKKKEKHEHSAIASSEVKQRLQEFVLNKKQREAKQAAAAAAVAGQPGHIQSGSNSNSSPPASIVWNPLLGKYEEDLMPLRKTASEPNLKIRSALKQKVLERRSSPFLRRKLGKLRGRPPLCSTQLTQHQTVHDISTGISSSAPVSASSSIEGESNTPPNSQVKSTPASPPPPINRPSSGHPLTAAMGMGSGSGSAPILEELRGTPGGGSRSPFSVLPPDLQLYSSPSLPNISLGRPHLPSIVPGGLGPGSTIVASENVKSLAEPQNRSVIGSNRFLSSSMSGSSPFPASLPYCPSLPVIEGEFSPPTSPTYIQNQMKDLQQGNVNTGEMAGHVNHYPSGPITETQVALARLQGVGRTGHRPLGRTQSAPLPLGHPMLQSATGVTSHDPVQHQRNLLKQHIRQTVLTRASSKQQLQSQSFEEETEAAVAQEMKDIGPGTPRKERIKRQYSQEADLSDENDEHLIDLTKAKEDKDESSSSTPNIHRKDRETFLHQQRDLISSQVSPSSAAHPSLEQSTVYHQILYQQQQQHLLLLQQQQQQHQQSVATSTQSGLSVSLLPEGNQFPQILPYSRYPYYHPTRPLSRASSSPLVAIIPTSQDPGNHSPPVTTGTRHCFTTGLVYDSLMLKHQCICGDNSQHPEHGGRLQSIWARLQETGLAMRCERIRSRKATLEEIQLCHSEPYSLLFGTSPLNRQKLDPQKLTDLPIKSFVMLPCGGIGVDSDTTWNELHTASAARMAAGCVTELALKVGIGEIKNGFAIVRPPGHHAESQQAMGFCFFNSVAVAVQQLKKRLNYEKVLIVDWDVHHGNGIQQIFYDDPHVLYVSVHRHDDGNFFPGTGDPNEIGAEDGTGFNVNVAWSGGLDPPLSDAEYLAAFRSIVMPIARDFDPDIILVASGFDAASGHPAPLGGYHVSPACFGWMTKQLLGLARGKVILALEGGYDLPSICDCSQECVAALLGDEPTPISEEELRRKPLEKAIETLRRIVRIQEPHWPIVKRYVHLIDCSHLEAQKKEREECEAVSALASLTMQHINSPPSSEHEIEEPMDQDVTK